MIAFTISVAFCLSPWQKILGLFCYDFNYYSLCTKLLRFSNALNHLSKLKTYLQSHFSLGSIWVKVFKNGPSNIWGRLPLKNFNWSIFEYLDPFGVHNEAMKRVAFWMDSSFKYWITETTTKSTGLGKGRREY